MDPQGLVYRVVDTIVGQRYFRAWLADSLDSMRRVACERDSASSPSRGA